MPIKSKCLFNVARCAAFVFSPRAIAGMFAEWIFITVRFIIWLTQIYITKPLRRVHFCTVMVWFCTISAYLQFISLKLKAIQQSSNSTINQFKQFKQLTSITNYPKREVAFTFQACFYLPYWLPPCGDTGQIYPTPFRA